MTTVFAVVVVLGVVGACVFLAGREEKVLTEEDEDNLPYAYLYNDRKRPTW